MFLFFLGREDFHKFLFGSEKKKKKKDAEPPTLHRPRKPGAIHGIAGQIDTGTFQITQINEKVIQLFSGELTYLYVRTPKKKTRPILEFHKVD